MCADALGVCLLRIYPEEFFWRVLHEHNYQIYHSKKLNSYHLEHPVDPVYLIESMKRNADYFTQIYPDAKKVLMHLWRGFGIYYPNPTVTRSYEFCKKIRKETEKKRLEGK